MKIIYHPTDDGKCAASIVNSELQTTHTVHRTEFALFTDLKNTEFHIGELVYLLGIDIDDELFTFIKQLIFDKKCDIICIGGQIKINVDQLDYKSREIINKVTVFYTEDVSTSLLTWVYSCMHCDERENPMGIEFDFSDKRTHVMLNPNETLSDGSPAREYQIPLVVRYIDDIETCRNVIAESKYFDKGFYTENEKNPGCTTWETLIYSASNMRVFKYVDEGRIIYKYLQMNKEQINDVTEPNEESSDNSGVSNKLLSRLKNFFKRLF